MAVNKNKKKSYLIPAIIAIVVIVVLIATIIVVKKKSNNSQMQSEEIAKIEAKNREETNEKIKAELSKKKEAERMQYYCGQFFSLISNGNYENAYKLLYSEYKENYFPNFANFERYFKEYFPESFALSYSNIERLGEIYVLNVSVKDLLYENSFDMYVVLKENDLNDFVISFSRNSAVGEEE